MVWLDDWANRIPIEIDHTKIDEDLTDFPVLITLSGSAVFDALTVSSTVDAYDVLFLDTHGDESSAANVIKVGYPGGALIGPKFTISSGIRCIYFDGSNDLMYVPSVTGYDLATEDFTLEAWVNNTLLSSVYRIMSHGAVDGSGAINGSWAFGIGSNVYWGTGIRLGFDVRFAGVAYFFVSDDLTSYISVNTWNHVAVVRSAGTLFFYLNGVQRGSVSCNYDLTLAAVSNLSIGYRYSGGYIEIFFGYLSKLRISKGTARYLSGFTPPTSYENDSYTTFLFMNEPNNNIAPSNLEINSYGETLISRATTPFNRNAAWDFGLASNDLIYVYDSSYLDLGSDDFTIDGWAYIKSYDGQGRYILSKRTNLGTSYIYINLAVSSTGYFLALVTNNGTSWGINFTGAYVPINTWFHFAFVRTGSTFDLYYNGIKTNTGTMTGAIVKDANSLSIGAGDNANNGDWYGYMYGLRISKGIARYSDNFVPGDPLEFNSSFSNRKKIAITDANNNQLYVEIERWDHATNKAWLWTKVPTVASGTNTQLYFYYDKTKSDNTSYVGDTTSVPAQNVWVNYKGVWHFNESTTTANSIKDSTSNGNHATAFNGGVNSNSIVNSKIGKGLDLETSSAQYVSMPSALSFRTLSSGTIEAIVTLESFPGTYYYSPFYDSTSAGVQYARFGIWLTGAAGRLHVSYRDSTIGESAAALSINDTNDNYLSTPLYAAATINADTDNLKVFRNGVRVMIDTTSKTNFSSSTSSLTAIGYNAAAANHYMDGVVDELRVSHIERSEAWIKATYYSNWNELLSFGAQEEPPYFFYEGYVKVQDAPSARRVCLYRRSTGQLVDTVMSDASTGYFQLQSRFPDYHFVVALANLEENFPPLFDDRIHPEI